MTHATASASEVALADAILTVLRNQSDSWTEVIVKRTYRPEHAFRVVRDTDGLRVEWPAGGDPS